MRLSRATRVIRGLVPVEAESYDFREVIRLHYSIKLSEHYTAFQVEGRIMCSTLRTSLGACRRDEEIDRGCGGLGGRSRILSDSIGIYQPNPPNPRSISVLSDSLLGYSNLSIHSRVSIASDDSAIARIAPVHCGAGADRTHRQFGRRRLRRCQPACIPGRQRHGRQAVQHNAQEDRPGGGKNQRIH